MTDLSNLEVLVGEWSAEVPGFTVEARTTFEWLGAVGS